MPLYHGSSYYIPGSINPQLAIQDQIPHVYATSDYNYVFVRCGIFNYNDIDLREDYDGNRYSLCEIQQGALKKHFDCDGWIYIFNNIASFTPTNLPNEYINENAYLPDNKIYIPNVLQTLELNPFFFKIIHYEDDQSQYWATVSGGKNGYINRRRQRNINYNNIVNNV